MADGDHIPCSHCGKQYNSVEDDKAEDDWLKCCSNWMHETCAEEEAVIGEDDFICKNCVN